jgi:DNA-directed RNA polymerase specialized sigma24 family protein
MPPRREIGPSEELRCGAPCAGAGVLDWRDAEATFDSYRALVTRWLHETILTMGLPHVDHLGRCARKGAEEAHDEEASWGVRRQLRDPGTTLIPAIVLEVQAEFFERVRAGRACLFHLRGLMFTITQRTAWRMATKRALELMRERLLWKDEMLPESGDAAATRNPEEILLAVERRMTEALMRSVFEDEISRLSPKKRVVVRGRLQDPPRSYEDLGAELGISPGACRKHFCEALAYLLRILKPVS